MGKWCNPYMYTKMSHHYSPITACTRTVSCVRRIKAFFRLEKKIKANIKQVYMKAKPVSGYLLILNMNVYTCRGDNSAKKRMFLFPMTIGVGHL